MKIQTRLLRKTALAAAVTLMVGGVASVSNFMGIETGVSSLVSTAYAAQGDSAGGGQGAMGAGRGGQGGQGAGGQGQRGGGQGQRGGKSVADVLADEADDDSDRPDWAGGNTEANPHSPGGGGQPSGAGTPKGDDYGDLIVLLRDPVTGEPILDGDQLQVCTDAACTDTVTMVDGEIPEGTPTVEVDFGRASVARSPANVIEHSLDEAIAKLTAEGVVIGTDAAGRITFTTADGVTSTIDSPLENLALYIDLMTGLADPDTVSLTEAALGEFTDLDTAASLLAGVADKTGDITLDFVVYENVIAGVVEAGDFYSFAGFDYERTYVDTTYFYTLDGGTDVFNAQLDVNEYLLAINGALPAANEDAAQFTAAADDALEVIELEHTQIHDLTTDVDGNPVLLPGTQ